MLNLEGQILKGRYRVEALVGRGGMAEVYKAWDARRQHAVAIKVMREDLAEDVEFLHRFRREAQALATLSHDNIVRFYEFEREGPVAFIVMDFVPGTTLRRLILEAAGEPLPVAAVASVTRQVAAALHYAHSENVLHRDVKPGNIMIRPDGLALVADFGIAKAADAATATTAMPGTPAYMSPEQCRSEPLDVRADVYGLGIVVYEMLAGRRPFVGKTAEVATGGTRERIRWEQIHAEPPPLQRFNPAVSPELEAVVRKALAKEREERWPMVQAFWRALAGALGEEASKAVFKPSLPKPIDERMPVGVEAPPLVGGEAVAQPALPGKMSPGVWVAGGIVLVALLIVGAVVGLRGTGAGDPTPAPLAPSAVDDVATEQIAIAVTLTTVPGGRTINAAGTKTAVAHRAEALAATETALARERRTATQSAVTHRVREATATPTGPTGTIAFQSDRSGRPQIYKVSIPDYPRPESLTWGPAHFAPTLSPDGRWLIFTGGGSTEESARNEVYVMNTVNGSVQRITHNSVPEKQPAISPDGSRVVYRAKRYDNWDIYVADRLSGDDSERDISQHSNKDYHPSWDPTGRWLVFAAERAGTNRDELYLMDAEGSNQTRITRNSTEDYAPVWSPDGRWIAFVSKRRGNVDIYMISVDGSSERRVTTNSAKDREPTWSPDGQWIAFSSDRTGNWDIFIANVTTGAVVAQVTDSSANDTHPTWTR